MICAFKTFLKESQGIPSIKFTIDYPSLNFVRLGSLKSLRFTDVAI